MRSVRLVLTVLFAFAVACSDDEEDGVSDGGVGDASLTGGEGTGGLGGGGNGTGGDDTGGGNGIVNDRPELNYIPMFPGAGTSDAADPLEGGEICDSVPGETMEAVSDLTRCFFGPDGGPPAATIEQVLECVDGVQTVHLRLTFDPTFADNSYGENAVGWPDGHTFDELVGSDHAELLLVSGDGEVALELSVDYISESDTAPSGYASECVKEKKGKGMDMEMDMEASPVVQCSTSIDRNLNERGYGEDYLENSPATDENYTPSMDAPEWDYRIVYEVWVDIEAFGDAGFSGAFINQVHASPSKEDEHTIEVTPGECPPCVDTEEYTCATGDTPGDSPGDDPDHPCGDDDPDTVCEDPNIPPDPDNPCSDGNPDTFCSGGDVPPGPEPAFCELYPTDPACKPE